MLIAWDYETHLISKDYPYGVTRDGRVYSFRSKRFLKTWLVGRGYPVVRIKNKTRYVHDLVLEVYNGPKPKGYVCNHKDGNKLNNCIDNLEYLTYSENNKHAYNTGLKIKGEGHCRAKLTDWSIQKIKTLYTVAGELQREIADRYGISQQHVSDVLKGKYRC